MSLIDVVGGVYDEVCLVPSWQALYGSGGRAASAIRSLGGAARLNTCFPAESREDIERLAIENGITIGSVFDGPRIRFEYLYSLRAETTTPPLSSITAVRLTTISLEDALVFGMLEATVPVTARRAVYDPQAGYRATPHALDEIAAEQLVLVCNLSEARGITNQFELPDVVEVLIEDRRLVAAIIKLGPIGALVVQRNGPVQRVPSVRTKHVFPIGSGDVFSGAFSHAWLQLGYEPEAAAKFASFSTARYCRYGALSALNERLAGRSSRLKASTGIQSSQRKTIYLAGPFFNLAQRWFIEEALGALTGLGLKVFSPLHDVGTGKSDKLTAKADLAGLEASDAVFAWVDDMDPGTIFEIGYARDRNIPVVMYGSNVRRRDLVMFVGSGVKVFDHFASALYATYWAANG